MHHRSLGKFWRTLTFLLAAFTTATSLHAEDHDLDRRTSDALRKAVNCLLAQQIASHKKSLFHTAPSPGDGESALILYALLSAGQTIDDPRLAENSPEIAALIQRVAVIKPQNVDIAFLQVEALCQTHLTPDIRTVLIDTQDMLESALGVEIPSAKEAADSPEIRITKNPADVLSARAAVAALVSLQNAGIETPPEVWQKTGQWLRSQQHPDGGWSLIPSDKKTDPAATTAALAALHELAEMMPDDPPLPLIAKPDSVILSATKRFAAEYSPNRLDYRYQIDVQRIALATGIQTINTTDTYDAFAELLLASQQSSGAWPATAPNSAAQSSLAATCKAIIFLSLGRAPIVLSKLDYAGDDSPATARPYDCALLTSWLSTQFDKPLAWQSVTFSTPVDDWSAAPILLITGSKDPHFSDADLNKLRAFIEAGGTILSSADGSDQEFTNAITKKYAPRLLGSKFQMRELPSTHELFAGKLYAKMSTPPPLLSLSNGIREIWIHSPTDMAANWASRRFAAHADFAFPANLVRYATGMGTLRNRFQSLRIEAPPQSILHKIDLALLDYTTAGNAIPEPGAWPRFADYAATHFHTQLNIQTKKITDLDAKLTPVAHLTGTASFTLSPAEISALKRFLNSGGTLLADSAGGNPDFTASFQKLMTTLYPDTPPAEVAINDPLYNGSIPDSLKITDIDYRKYFPGKTDDRDNVPHLQSITIDGRHLILFSPQDITSGLLGTETWSILGFTPDSANRLTQNMLLYAAPH